MPSASKSANVLGSRLNVFVSCQSWPIAMRMGTLSPLERLHRYAESAQRFIDVSEGHCRTEAVMARSAAVVVEIHAMLECGADEIKHLLALVPHDVAVAARCSGDAEVDAKPSAEALHGAGDAMMREQRIQAVIQFARNRVDMLVKAG